MKNTCSFKKPPSIVQCWGSDDEEKLRSVKESEIKLNDTALKMQKENELKKIV